MPNRPRMTTTTKMVLAALTDGCTYGRAIVEATGLASGTVYPILDRLESHGWVASVWEDVNPVAAHRPRRRLYELTEAGGRRAAT